MSKGLHIMSKLAQAVDGYHKKGTSPHPSSLGAKEGPAGPEHDGPVGPGAALAEHDQDQIHHTDMEKLQEVICPGCHDKLRAHLVAGASGSKDPVSHLHLPKGVE